ncbi:MAG TPA: TolC family protein [Gemmataceae bacterium]|nr:TolC family protein [Gemmataceae bacterium]
MRRRLTVSALFGLGLLALTATGQPPGTSLVADPDPKAVQKKPADPLEAQIAAALANDPDVKVAQAKVQLAEAELTKARQLVAQKVVTLNAAITEQKPAVAAAEENFRILNEQYKRGGVGYTEVLAAREKLETAKAKLARLETELKLLTGGGPGGVGAAPADEDGLLALARENDRRILLAWLRAHEKATGPVPARLRAALDKKVTLGPKGEKVPFDKALEVFKRDAGLEVVVRPMPSPMPVIVSEGEELPVGAWFQLYQDVGGRQAEGLAFYVRDYGILVATRQTAPPDALTITQFWQLPPPKEEPKN